MNVTQAFSLFKESFQGDFSSLFRIYCNLFTQIFGVKYCLITYGCIGFQVNMHKSDIKSLHKKVPQELLPEELGGKLGPADALAEVDILFIVKQLLI